MVAQKGKRTRCLGRVKGNRVRAPFCREFFLSAGTMCRKYPIPRLIEWIEYHLAVGFDHLFICYNVRGKTIFPDVIKETASAEEKNKFRSAEEEEWKRYKRSVAYYERANVVTMAKCQNMGTGQGNSKLVVEFGWRTFWLQRFDTDEFLVPADVSSVYGGEAEEESFYSLVPKLLPFTGKQMPAQLSLPSYEFGDSGRSLPPPTHIPLTEAFRRRIPTPDTIKGLIQTDAFLSARRGPPGEEEKLQAEVERTIREFEATHPKTPFAAESSLSSPTLESEDAVLRQAENRQNELDLIFLRNNTLAMAYARKKFQLEKAFTESVEFDPGYSDNSHTNTVNRNIRCDDNHWLPNLKTWVGAGGGRSGRAQWCLSCYPHSGGFWENLYCPENSYKKSGQYRFILQATLSETSRIV
eukprot:g7188.t1